MRYICKECGTDCTKPPLVKAKDGEVQRGLGAWRCPHCGKHAKVKRVN